MTSNPIYRKQKRKTKDIETKKKKKHIKKTKTSFYKEKCKKCRLI